MRKVRILALPLLVVLVLLIGMGAGACDGGGGGEVAPPPGEEEEAPPEEEEETAPPEEEEEEAAPLPGEEEEEEVTGQSNFTSDDGRVEIALDNVERTKVWPAELQDGGTPKEGYDFIVVDVTIVRITDGHVNARQGSAIVGYDEVKYQALSGTWWGIEYQDPHDIRAGYEIVEGATGKFVVELPEGVQPVSLRLTYLFFESWTESWERVGEEERYMDIILSNS